MISRSGVYKNYIRGAVDVACHVREDVCSLCDVYDEFETYIEILAFVGVEVGLPEALPLLERELSTAFQCNALGNAVSAIVCSGGGHRRMHTNSTDEHYM